MFSYTGLNEAQVNSLIHDHHIHMMKNGRIAMVGLTTKNTNYVAEAINDVVKNIKWLEKNRFVKIKYWIFYLWRYIFNTLVQ